MASRYFRTEAAPSLNSKNETRSSQKGPGPVVHAILF
jgi:hypothetical protein